MRRLSLIATAVLIAATSCGGGSPAIPGGRAGDPLELVDGKLPAYESTPPAEVQRAICEFLFGTPKQVAAAAKLAGHVTLNPDSGWRTLGGNGTQFACTYDVDGDATYRMAVWWGGDRAEDTSGRQEAVGLVEVEFPNDTVAYSMYRTGYQGEIVDPETAKKWLTAAHARTGR